MVNRPLSVAYNAELVTVGARPISWSVFDDPERVADTFFLNGVPGLAYSRARTATTTVFLGACLPYRDPARPVRVPAGRADGRRTVLVSQGTVDNHNADKLIVPTLKALVGSGFRVLVATGSADVSRRLRPRYAGPDVVVDDWIDFDATLPQVDVFVCNGGNGSLLAALRHGVPLVCAGTREGKRDNNAHIAHHGLGIDLRTERPTPRALRRAVARVLVEPVFRQRAALLQHEIAEYDPHVIVDRYLAALDSAGSRPAVRTRRSPVQG